MVSGLLGLCRLQVIMAHRGETFAHPTPQDVFQCVCNIWYMSDAFALVFTSKFPVIFRDPRDPTNIVTVGTPALSVSQSQTGHLNPTEFLFGS